MKVCSVEGCNGKHKGYGFCSRHYQQFVKKGKITDYTRRFANNFILENGYVKMELYDKNMEILDYALIDEEDIEKIKNIKWTRIERAGGIRFYVYGGNKSKTPYILHRVIMDAKFGQIIDHINHNGLDCRKQNLRFVTNQQNCFNARKKSTISASKYKGVTWHKGSGFWHSRIGFNGKTIFLGAFSNERDAAAAYNRSARKLFGEYAELNTFTDRIIVGGKCVCRRSEISNGSKD